MIVVPAVPDLPSTHSAQTHLLPRYEDVTQDGRFSVNNLPHLAGYAVWQPLLSRHPFSTEYRTTGVFPILSRMVVDAGAGPFSMAQPIDIRSHYQLAHSRLPSGDVSRLYMRFWMDASGHVDHSRSGKGGPQVASRALAGRCFVEHVFTRLFAPPDQRRVTSVSWPGETPVPPTLIEDTPPEETLSVSPGLTPLTADFVRHEAPIIFGLIHTDSNQHVNSLVYTRLFEEVCVSHLHSRGIKRPLLGRGLRIAYRKPCFAGESMAFWLQAHQQGDEYLVSGYLTEFSDAAEPPLSRHTTQMAGPDGHPNASASRPRIFIQMHFAA